MPGILQGILEQGFIYAIIAMGVYITYSILDFPDLTVDGSFPLGAAVCARLITAGANGWAALLASVAAGILAGVVTGIIHVKFHVRNLLSGILTMTGLYSVNIAVAGAANIPLFNKPNIFNTQPGNLLIPAFGEYNKVVLILIMAIAVKLALDWYLQTKSGMLLRAAGDNEQLVTAMAKDNGSVKIVGLAMANALVALGGGIICQQSRVFNVTIGTGTIVICLASIITGLSLFRRSRHIKQTTAAAAGAVIYQAVVGLAIQAGVRPEYMKGVMAVILVGVLIFNHVSRGGEKRA